MCPMPTGAERRQYQRFPMTTGVMCYHEPSGRDIPVRSQDISAGGMKLFLPPTAPVRAGHGVYVDLGGIARPELLGRGDEPIPATIVRVDRSTLTTDGHLVVGIRFEE